jgi:glycosyltransferase involved in cell wall biosynthesis
MNAPRILHLISHFGGGGTERQASYLIPELAAQGWDVHVGYLRGGPNLERLERASIPLLQIQASGNHDPRLLFRLVSLIRHLRPALVQTWLPQMDILGSLAAQWNRISWILSERSSTLSQGLHPRMRIRAALARQAKAIIANSPEGADYWKARTGRRVERFIIPNSLPLDEIRKAPPLSRTMLKVSENAKVILHVGRLVDYKNLVPLMHALQILFRESDAVTVLCGEGPMRPALEKLARAFSLQDRIRFTGYVTDVWSWMKASDLVVSTSLFEGQPNSILEALACGRPLVVSDIPGHRHFLDERLARFVPTDDPQAIAHVLKETLSDPVWCTTQSSLAEQYVECLSIQRMAESYGAAYRRLLLPLQAR